MGFAVDKSLRSLLVVAALLTIFGIVMVYSSSYIYAKENFGSSSYFFKKQLIFTVIGLLFAVVIQKRNFAQLFKDVQVFHLIAIGLLFCTFVPGLWCFSKGFSTLA